MRKKKKKTIQHYVMVKDGIVQYWEQEGKEGLIICEGIDAARAIAATRAAGGASPARVGSVAGETLESHLMASLDKNCEGFWYCRHYPEIHWSSFDTPPSV